MNKYRFIVFLICAVFSMLGMSPSESSAIVIIDSYPGPVQAGWEYSATSTCFNNTSACLGNGTFLFANKTGGGIGAVDSFFDVFFDVEITTPAGPRTGPTRLSGPVTVRTLNNNGTDFQIEIVSMDLTGSSPNVGSVRLAESSALPSPGQTTLIPLPSGQYQVDSFFDVFTEISFDGGRTYLPGLNGIRLQISRVVLPEPSAFILLASGLLGLVILRRKSVNGHLARK